jgi:outer membrane protein TolC
MKKQLVFLFVLTTGFLIGAGAQTSGAAELTVDDAVKLALDNNLSLKRGALDAEGKKRASARSWNMLIPTIRASAQESHPTRFYTELPPGQNNWTTSLSVSSSLTLSVSALETIKKARSDYEAGLLTLEQAKTDVELQTRKLFYQILLYQANVNLAQRNLESAQARYDQSAARAKVGQASRLDELTARVDLEKQRPTVRNTQMLYENALDTFKTLIGLPRGTEITLRGDLGSDESIAGAGAFLERDTAGNGSLETAALQKTIENLEIQRKEAWYQAYLPNLTLQWNPSFQYGNNAWSEGGSSSFSISVSLNLDNFFPWSASKTKLESLDDSVRSSQMRLAETLRSREDRISQYRRTIEKTMESIAAAKLNVELAQSTYAMYEEAYRNGTADYQSLRNAADSSLQVENQLQQEQYNLISTILDLEKELNVPFGTLGGQK